MSNEPILKGFSAQPSAEAAEARSDADRMQSALQRMKSAVRGASDPIERLPGEFAEMAETIKRIRAAVDAGGHRYTDVGALLQDLERRMQRVTALVGPAAAAVALATTPATEPPAIELPATGPPVTEPPVRPADEQAFLDAMAGDGPNASGDTVPAAEQVRVPTVSEVVWQLGRPSEPTAVPTADAPPPVRGEGVTTVAMLEAMVEKLTATMPAAQPPPNGVAQSPPEMPPGEAAEAPDAPAHAPRHPIMPEVELLSNYARMEAIAFLPPEVGTAVIFQAQARPEAAAVEAAPPSAAAADQPALSEAILVMPPADQAEAAAPEPSLKHPQTIEAPAAASSEARDVDLDALLFEPQLEAEPDPAASLLEPAPSPTPTPTQSQPDAAEPAHGLFGPGERRIAAAPDRPAFPADAAYDPLGPLKAMSDEERIALFE